MRAVERADYGPAMMTSSNPDEVRESARALRIIHQHHARVFAMGMALDAYSRPTDHLMRYWLDVANLLAAEDGQPAFTCPKWIRNMRDTDKGKTGAPTISLH